MPHMLYRSPWTRWFLAGIGITTGVIFAFGDGHKWRSTPSLHWLAQAPIPLPFWGLALIAYGMLLLFEQTRPVGYAAGAVLLAIFTTSLVATLPGPDPKNILAVMGMVDAIVFHVYSIGIALMIRDSSAAARR